jgi:hypothetical protein
MEKIHMLSLCKPLDCSQNIKSTYAVRCANSNPVCAYLFTIRRQLDDIVLTEAIRSIFSLGVRVCSERKPPSHSSREKLASYE